MAKPIYQIISLDTAAARTGEFILPHGTKYDSVKVIAAPGGLVPRFSFSGSADASHLIPFAVGDEMRFVDECNNPFQVNEGLILSHNAVVGTLQILISQGVSH